MNYDDLDECEPVITNAQMGFNSSKVSADGTTKLVESNPAIPCGLIAKSLFNDTYFLIDSDDKNITITVDNIAWPSDKNRYANTNDLSK